MINKKTTNEIYDELHDRLLYPSLFYISLELLNKLDQKHKSLMELKHVIFALEDRTYNFIVQEDSNISFLLFKSEKLSTNVFALVDYQSILSENQFFVLLKKYKRQLDAYVEVSELLSRGIDENSKPIFQKTKGHFLMQEMNLKEHQKVINESFTMLKKATFPKMKLDSILKKNVLIDPQKISLAKGIPSAKNKKATKKQQLLIDDDAIQDFLIRTVFTRGTQT